MHVINMGLLLIKNVSKKHSRYCHTFVNRDKKNIKAKKM
jgi:hypothetical protein